MAEAASPRGLANNRLSAPIDISSSTPPLAPSDFLPHLGSTTAAPTRSEDAATPYTASIPGTNGSSKPTVDAQGRALNPRSCVTCRKRKVKCDKLHPCNHCTRAKIECVFPAPGRAPRKAKKPGEGRDKELLERLRRLEGVVKGMGVEVPGGVLPDGDVQKPEESVEAHASEDAEMGEQEPYSNYESSSMPSQVMPVKGRMIEEQQQDQLENRFGRLVVNEGKSRYINTSFWANLSNEVEDLKGILNQSSDEEGSDDGSPNFDPNTSSNHQGWTFGFSSQSVDLLSLHPMPGQIQQYWETYKDRVDPLLKVLHMPTTEPTVLSAASHLGNLSKGFEALLFAIYYGAVTSVSAADCLLMFGEEKGVLLSRYRFAVEQALARANFLTTEEIVVLQAFVIFLICLRRNSDARVIWTLTGLVVRIAQTIGIHRDGSHFALPPFEVEMRRRLWWQVCLLDTRASEDHGCDPTITEQSFDTEMPLNIKDIDLWPSMQNFPAERQGCTDMTFCLIRFEVSNTFRRINYVPPGSKRRLDDATSLQEKEKWITDCHHRLEERYLAHCDMSVPLYWVTATVARLMMSKMWLMVYHPFQRQGGGTKLPPETKDKLYITSLENIEYSLLMETDARTMKWGWLFRTYMQWHALVFMLSELCLRTKGDLVERAWDAVEKTRDLRWGEYIADERSGHLWRPLKKLYRKAKTMRQQGIKEEELMNSNAKQFGGNDLPKRYYSPNANPMFGHPNRPHITRAPLSHAQALRFSEGPTFGQMPLDKHELLKSPKFSEVVLLDADIPDADPQDGMLQRTLPPAATQNFFNDLSRRSMSSGISGQQLYAPSALRNGSVSFPQNFVPNQREMEYTFPVSSANNQSVGPDLTSFNIPGEPLLRMNSNPAFNAYDPGGTMDTTGDLSWENWDQLVRQFGMEVDSGPGAETLETNAPAAGWEQPNWEMGPGSANLRMGMGMGGGDWF